jgi:hypothetical protein
MPRYFFNLTDGSTIRDPDGEDLADVEAAKATATQVARDVGRNKERTQIAGLHVTVTNEQGEEIFRTPLAL